ncbi:MAG TPA: riboflavin synthase [Thermodesulfovibrionales bacterium]|nr:riboflavin synthase [Thermodesulfovibrionales bacterium]
MFTGIIAEMGEVLSLRLKRPGATLTVKAPVLARDTVIGDSIAINGACLTVVGIEESSLSFDLSGETLTATNLGQLKVAERVNLEPSLRPDGKLGGHFVSGHVDAVGTIRTKSTVGDTLRIVVAAPSRVAGFLVEKGSVAVDGISLTVVEVSDDGFSVVIIPHTVKVTTLGFKNVGDSLNLEADIIGKYVARFLAGDRTNKADRDGQLMKSLAEAGYLDESRKGGSP